MNPKYRVAIILVGMTRRFREASKSLFDNLINLYPEVQFDFFLYTWNVYGDYKYENKDFSKPLNNNWVSHEPIPQKDIDDLHHIYNPKFLKMEDYVEWEKNIQLEFKEFIEKHNCTEEPLRIFNGIFAQYYQVQQGFKAFEDWARENEIDLNENYYDLIIRSRFDLEILKKPDFNWDILIQRSKTHILGLEQWDRYGMRGNWIGGCYRFMRKYAQFYSDLNKLSVKQIKDAKLASVTVPKFIFNYIFADRSDPENMDIDEIFRRVRPYFIKQVNDFISVPSRLQFRVSLIPETFLKYYLEKYRAIPVYLEEFLDTKVVDGQKSHPI